MTKDTMGWEYAARWFDSERCYAKGEANAHGLLNLASGTLFWAKDLPEDSVNEYDRKSHGFRSPMAGHFTGSCCGNRGDL